MHEHHKTHVCEEFCFILVDRGGSLRCRDCGSFFSLRYKVAIIEELTKRFGEPELVVEELERLKSVSRRVSRIKGAKAEGMTFYGEMRKARGDSLKEHIEGWHE